MLTERVQNIVWNLNKATTIDSLEDGVEEGCMFHDELIRRRALTRSIEVDSVANIERVLNKEEDARSQNLLSSD